MKTSILAAVALLVAAPAFASSERPFEGFARPITSGHQVVVAGAEASPMFLAPNATVRNDRLVISTAEGFALQSRG